jgi:hypothetical protein
VILAADSEQSAEIDMRLLGVPSRMVFCSLGYSTCRLRSAWDEMTC